MLNENKDLGIIFYCMLKNENEIVEQLIHNTVNIADYFFFLDTGSTDGTMDTINEIFGKLGKTNYCIKQTEFVNFVETRNYGLDLLNKSKEIKKLNFKHNYILLMDADEYFHIPEDKNPQTFLNEEIRPFLLSVISNTNDKGDNFTFLMNIKEGESFMNKRQRFVPMDDIDNKIKFRYDGPGAHECISNVLNNNDIKSMIIPNQYFIHHKHKVSKDYAKKFELEGRLIEEYLQKNPEDLRGWFYLGNTYFDIRHHSEENFVKAEKCYSTYLKLINHRVMNDIFIDELYEIFLRISQIYIQWSDYERAINIYQSGINLCPNRRECYYFLIRLHLNLGETEFVKKIIPDFERTLYKPFDPNSINMWFDMSLVMNEMYHWYFLYRLQNPNIKDLANSWDNIEDIQDILTNWSKNIESYLDNDFLTSSEIFAYLQANKKWFETCLNFDIKHWVKESYRNKKSNIIFYLGNRHPFDQDKKLNEHLDLDSLRLGGTERSYVELMKRCSDKTLGMNFNCIMIVDDIGDLPYLIVDNMLFVKADFWINVLKWFIPKIQCVIQSRFNFMEVMDSLGVEDETYKKILWIHDIHSSALEYDAERNLADEIVVGTNFHKRFLINQRADINLKNSAVVKQLESKIKVVPLGINDNFFSDTPKFRDIRNKKTLKIFYHIHPERGLNPLLEIFADLREYFKTKYDVVLQLDAYVEDTYDIGKLNMLKRFKPELLNQDGVNILKCIPQSEIANKMKEYDMFFYIHDTNWKNHKMIFLETFCLSVVEAQLCGLITFATNIGGLNDTLKSGKEPYINRLTISDSYIQNRTQLLNKITEQIDILMSDSIDKHKCEPLIRNEDFYNWDYIYLYRWKNLINY